MNDPTHLKVFDHHFLEHDPGGFYLKLAQPQPFDGFTESVNLSLKIASSGSLLFRSWSYSVQFTPIGIADAFRLQEHRLQRFLRATH